MNVCEDYIKLQSYLFFGPLFFFSFKSYKLSCLFVSDVVVEAGALTGKYFDLDLLLLMFFCAKAPKDISRYILTVIRDG